MYRRPSYVSFQGHLPWWENVLTIKIVSFYFWECITWSFYGVLGIKFLDFCNCYITICVYDKGMNFISDCCLNSCRNLIVLSSLFYFLQKTGFLDFQTNFAANDGRCYRWLAFEANKLASERWHYCSRDSLGSRCKNRKTSLIILQFQWN